MKEGAGERRPGRLPEGVAPERYEIRLQVDPDGKRFSGTVRIEAVLSRPVQTIILHALDLVVLRAEVGSDSEMSDAAVAVDEKEETIALTPSRPLTEGKATIRLEFSGALNPHLRGLYEARAVVDGKEERYAFTQFEATDARRAFPCFDEPSLKARFKLIAVIPAHLMALSNMPAVREETIGAWKTVEFSETPRMSTYLLALAVARLECRALDVAGVRVAVWTAPGQTRLGAFALEVAAAVLPRLNDYFDLPYPYPKLDMIAVPDFAMGAMENWGAIFFRDSRLLVDPVLASTQTQRIVANVITHEIVHQWFGNLVTMWWWDDLWLNEAFATWLAVKIVDQWRPEWNSWVEFQQEKAVPLAVDALDSTRPIRADVKSAAEAEEMFDALTYEKGAAVLRMIEQFLGEDAFREGLRRYIADHQYGCAAAADLWKALETASGQPVQSMARDWFEQPGFPRLIVGSRGTSLQTLELEQRRFSAHGAGAEREERVWTVPVAFKIFEAGGSRIHRVLLRERSARIRLPVEGPARWIYANADETGFFRVTYDEGLLNVLKAAIPSGLTAAERIGFIDHLWAQTRAGDLPIAAFLDVLDRFKGDSTRVVVESCAAVYQTLAERIVLPESLPAFRKRAGKFFAPIWSALKWTPGPEEGDETKLIRAAALWGMGSVARSRGVLTESEERLGRYLADPASCDPTLATPLVCIGAKIGGSARFDDYLERFKTGETPEDRDRYLDALADFEDVNLCRRLLEFTLTDALRSQDLWKPFGGLLANPAAQGETWRFVQKEWPALRKKGGSVAAQRIIRSTRALWREEWYQEVKGFFENPTNREPSAERTLAQTLEFIRLGIRFKETQQRALSNWLSVS